MRLLLAMPTGLQIGYDDFFSSSPLGIETLAAHARELCDVSLIDLRDKGHEVQPHAEQLLARSPDMIGICLNACPHTKYTLALAAALKRARGDLKILVGGQQATYISEELLSAGNIDAVVRGEGEWTLEEILRRDGDWRGVAGVSWRDGSAIRHEPDRPQIPDLDLVKMPAKDLLPDRSHYRMGKYRVEGIESSRGCPYQCSFCSIRNFHRGKWRPKSVGRVMQEVDHILEHYPEEKVIYFADDNFTQDIRRVEQICQAIIERKTAAYFWCQARVDRLSQQPKLIELMGRAKFAAVLTGIETPIPRLLKSAKKGTSVEQIEKAIEMLHANDIGVWGTFTLGLPGETREETYISADYVAKAKVDVIQITVATPVPGSSLYETARKDGDILITDWDGYDFTSPTLRGQLSSAEMNAIMHKAYFRGYTNWQFLRSFFSSRTNLDRLRRTAFGVFWWWIKLLLKERLSHLLGKRAHVVKSASLEEELKAKAVPAPAPVDVEHRR